MNPKSDEFKEVLSSVRERYALAKRRTAKNQMIGVGGCNYIGAELDNILEKARSYCSGGDYSIAYAVAVTVLKKCGWLSSYADSSSGWLGETVYQTQEVIREVCTTVPRDSDDAKYILRRGLKDYSHKDFDGWEDYSYGLLRSIAILSDAKTAPKLYQALDDFTAKLEQQNIEHDYDWLIGRPNVSDMLVRYEVIHAVDGENAANDYAYANLEHDSFRGTVIKNAVKMGAFDEAERLCLERLATYKYHEKPYTSPSEWDYMLYDIYEKACNVEKQIETAEKILFLYDTRYFDVLKNLLTEKGEWEQKYLSLREALQNEFPSELYMKFLKKEGDHKCLIEQIRIFPQYVFDYGKFLSMYYPVEIRQIFINEIYEQAAAATARPHYRKVCANIKKLSEYIKFEDVFIIINELKAQYSHRPAMLNELETLECKLESQRIREKSKRSTLQS